MVNQATILLTTDEAVAGNKALQQYIEHTTDDYCTLWLEGELLVVMKNIKEQKQTSEKIRMLAGAIARKLSSHRVEKATVQEKTLAEGFSNLQVKAAVTAFVEGWHLGTYAFLPYKSKEKPFSTTLEIIGDGCQKYVETGRIRAEATAFSRDLMNERPSALNPETFPERLREAFSDTNVKVTVFDKTELEAMQMNGVLTVSQGSQYAPAFVELTYQSDASKPLVALVGKGVTFDTGGITLKKSKYISNMRMDMGGAAAVSGAMKLLAKSGANVNVTALIPIVENMPDAHAMLPGEVIRYKNGHTVQIGNTDAEGRLILADGLIRAGELKADYVVDIATLTGAIVNALGTRLAGVFGAEQLAMKMKQIGDANGDFNWPMPLVDAYDSYLDSDYADFSNTSSKAMAGSITAALFLRRFVIDPSKWLHVDMAGVMESREAGYYPKGASGFGARLLADFVEDVSSSASDTKHH